MAVVCEIRRREFLTTAGGKAVLPCFRTGESYLSSRCLDSFQWCQTILFLLQKGTESMQRVYPKAGWVGTAKSGSFVLGVRKGRP